MALIVRGRWKSRNGVTDWITRRERDGKTKVTRRETSKKDVRALKLACSRGRENRELKE
jgi:hypothetical protein